MEITQLDVVDIIWMTALGLVTVTLLSAVFRKRPPKASKPFSPLANSILNCLKEPGWEYRQGREDDWCKLMKGAISVKWGYFGTVGVYSARSTLLNGRLTHEEYKAIKRAANDAYAAIMQKRDMQAVADIDLTTEMHKPL